MVERILQFILDALKEREVFTSKNLNLILVFLFIGVIARFLGFNPGGIIRQISLIGQNIPYTIVFVGYNLIIYGLTMTLIIFILLSLLFALYYGPELIYLVIRNIINTVSERRFSTLLVWPFSEAPNDLVILAKSWRIGFWLASIGFLLALLLCDSELLSNIVKVRPSVETFGIEESILTLAVSLVGYGVFSGLVQHDRFTTMTIILMTLFGLIFPGVVTYHLQEVLFGKLKIFNIAFLVFWLLIMISTISLWRNGGLPSHPKNRE